MRDLILTMTCRAPHNYHVAAESEDEIYRAEALGDTPDSALDHLLPHLKLLYREMFEAEEERRHRME